MLPSTVPSLVGALYGRGSGGRSSPQKLWDKWCKILHSRSLLGLNFIIETSFFVLFFSYFQQLFKIKDSFFTTFDYIVAVIQTLQFVEELLGA
jgi:hypothetical protein